MLPAVASGLDALAFVFFSVTARSLFLAGLFFFAFGVPVSAVVALAAFSFLGFAVFVVCGLAGD